MKDKMLAATVIGACLFQPIAFSSPETGTFYVGGSLGTSEMTDDDDLESDVKKIQAGLTLDRNVAVEAEWIRMEDFDYDGFDDDLNGLDSDTINMSAIYMLPLGNNFDIIAKGGFHYTRFDFSNTGFDAIDDSEESGVSLGLGAVYSVTPDFGIRTEYQKLYNATETNGDFELYSIGVTFRF